MPFVHVSRVFHLFLISPVFIIADPTQGLFTGYYLSITFQADIGHFLQFCLQKSDKHSLIIGLLWQQLKSQTNKTYIFGCSIHIL